ncbi:DUF6941 family protein [Enterococcus italicus]|uniref:DUF6941 family protein n=1 Tax=Enterococcus italicus TaxID=246144 RepID=UPI0020738F7B|nr:hypothetical protein [Enterococcus italicus]
MIIGNIFLADSINNQQNGISAANPNLVYTALSYPAFLSFDAALTICGIEQLDGLMKLSVDLYDDNENFMSTLVEGEQQLPDFNSSERMTLNIILNLRKVVINTAGLYTLVVKVNSQEITRTKFEAWIANGK